MSSIDFFRQRAGAWYVKLLLFLITLTFMFVGISSFWQDRGDVLVKINDNILTKTEFDNRMQQAVGALEERTGMSLTREDLVQEGYDIVILQEIILKMILENNTRRLNLVISDEVVNQIIRQDPNFITVEGEFDYSSFRNYISQNNITEYKYFTSFKRSIALDNLTHNFSAFTHKMNRNREKLVFAYENEKRIFSYVAVPIDNIKTDYNPTNEELRGYYLENQESFARPELRKIRYVDMSCRVFAQQLTILESDLEEYLATKKEQFSIPEKRSILILRSDNLQALEIIEEKLEEGEDFNKQASLQDNILLEKREVLFEDLQQDVAEVIFQMSVGQYTRPINLGDGFYIIKVDSIKEAQNNPMLAEVRAQVEEKYRYEKGCEMALKTRLLVENDLLTNPDADLAAYQLEWQTAEVEIDLKNPTASTISFADMTNQAQIVRRVAGLGEVNEVTRFENGDTYALIFLEEITPPGIKEFNSVKDDISYAMVEKVREQEFMEIYSKVNSDIAKVADLNAKKMLLESFAKKYAVEVEASELARFGLPSGRLADFAGDLRAKLFAMEVNQVSLSEGELNNQAVFFISLLEEIAIPSLEDEQAKIALQSLEQAYNIRVSRSLFQDYIDDSKNSYKIKINDR